MQHDVNRKKLKQDASKLSPECRFFLAQRGFKVANYPVIPDEEPPEDLFNPEHQQPGKPCKKAV